MVGRRAEFGGGQPYSSLSTHRQTTMDNARSASIECHGGGGMAELEDGEAVMGAHEMGWWLSCNKGGCSAAISVLPRLGIVGVDVEEVVMVLDDGLRVVWEGEGRDLWLMMMIVVVGVVVFVLQLKRLRILVK